jgi:hypothetical protein
MSTNLQKSEEELEELRGQLQAVDESVEFFNFMDNKRSFYFL